MPSGRTVIFAQVHNLVSKHRAGKGKNYKKGGKLSRMCLRNQEEQRRLLDIGIDLRRMPKKKKNTEGEHVT